MDFVNNYMQLCLESTHNTSDFHSKVKTYFKSTNVNGIKQYSQPRRTLLT